MPADFDACVNAGGRVRRKTLKGGKYMNICFDKAGKSHASHVKSKGESMSKINWINEVMTESLKEGEKDMVKIRGTAIKARESRNGVVYEMNELSKASPSLRGKSIALDHSESVADNVGIIDNVIETADGLEYEGRAFNTGKHPYIIELLQKGLIRHVSIEATTPQIEEKADRKIARNLEFLGLAFVRHPGIPEATASICEALDKVPADSDKIDEEFEFLDDADFVAEMKLEYRKRKERAKEAMHGKSEHKCEKGMHWDEKEMKCMPDMKKKMPHESVEKLAKEFESIKTDIRGLRKVTPSTATK